MKVINGDEPIFHLFEVYTGNISPDQNVNTTREVYGTLKWVRSVKINEIASDIKANKHQMKGGTIQFDVPIYDNTIDGYNVEYDNVDYNYTYWKDVVTNQLKNTKNKTYFITTTKSTNNYNFTDTITMVDSKRVPKSGGGFVDDGFETVIPNTWGFVPHFHGWLTGIDSTDAQDRYTLTFSNFFELLNNTIADTSIAYISNDYIDQNDERTESHNSIVYNPVNLPGFLGMVGETFKGLCTPTTNRNGLPTFNKYNFGQKDFYNRNMSTIKKIDERIYAGLDYDPICRNSNLMGFTVGELFSIQKYGNALDVLTTITQSQGRVEISPNIMLVPSYQPGHNGHPHYQFHMDLFPAPCTRDITLKMNQVDIKYNTMDSQYATNWVVQDLGDTTAFADGYHGWLYAGELGYPVVRFQSNQVDESTFPDYPSKVSVQNSIASANLIKSRVRYINISVKEEDDINFGNDTFDNEYFDVGDKINITVDELASTFNMIITGKIMYVDPDTFLETYNFVLERLD